MEYLKSTAGQGPRANDLRAVLSGLALRIGKERYEIWFRNSTRLRLDDAGLEVQVPNSFIQHLLTEQCAEPLRAAAEEALGKPVVIRFAVKPEAFGSKGGAPADGASAVSGAAAVEIAPVPPTGRDSGEPLAETVVEAALSAALDGDSIVRSGRSPGAPRPAAPGPRRQWMVAGLPAGRRCTLSEFVVGPNNRMAHAAACSVVEKPGTLFSPLFIHGKCGLGKTHLLLGIAAALCEGGAKREVVYTSAEEFTNLFLSAMRAGKAEQFRREVRALDVLIIDDIHFLARKHATQEEFLHTFDSIEADGRQVVLASDSPPRDLEEFSAHLVSRFVKGMVTAVEPPDFSTRRNILRAKADRAGARLGDDVLDYLAETVVGNVRDLEGALTRVVAAATLTNGGKVDRRLAQELIPPAASANRRGPPVVARIEQAVADCFGVRVADLCGAKRGNGLNVARTALMYLLREHTNWTLQQIADHLDRKNHSTVLLACRRMQEMIDGDDPLPLPDAPRDNPARSRAVMKQLADTVRRAS